MEENKTKTVELNSKQPSKKLSYEELEQVASQLSEQSRQLYEKLRKTNLENMFMRLNYLFRVVENKDVFSSEFVNKCVEEIQEAMTLPEKAEEDNKENKA